MTQYIAGIPLWRGTLTEVCARKLGRHNWRPQAILELDAAALRGLRPGGGAGGMRCSGVGDGSITGALRWQEASTYECAWPRRSSGAAISGSWVVPRQ